MNEPNETVVKKQFFFPQIVIKMKLYKILTITQSTRKQMSIQSWNPVNNNEPYPVYMTETCSADEAFHCDCACEHFSPCPGTLYGELT